MSSDILKQRIKYIRTILLDSYNAGKELSNAAKGYERELFIANVLSNIVAPPFRIGSGDIIDSEGNSTGQLDIVVEYGNSISFPVLQKDHPRLYLVEGVCAIIEIKSDIAKQWNEVLDKHDKVRPLIRKRGANTTVQEPQHETIPHFGVGYIGWKDEETVKSHIVDSGMSGLLILDSNIYCNNKGECRSDDYALFCFLQELHAIFASLIACRPNYSKYMK